MEKPTTFVPDDAEKKRISEELAQLGDWFVSPEDALIWMNKTSRDLVFIRKPVDAKFKDWTESDFACNFSTNRFEPYAFDLPNYIVIHDYC